MVKKKIKNWDNKTWLSSNSYNKSFNKYLSHPIPKNLKYEVEKGIFF